MLGDFRSFLCLKRFCHAANSVQISCQNSTKAICVLQGHQYRNVCDLRRGAVTSLITVDFATHTAQDSYNNPRVPSGFPFSTVKAKLSELDFIFLNRFIQEILQYVSVLLALRPPPIQQQIQQTGVPALATASAGGTAEPQSEAPKDPEQSGTTPEASKEVGAVVQMDIEMEAPVISMPRSSDSQDSVQLDLGFVNLHNSLKWIGGSSTEDPKVSSGMQQWHGHHQFPSQSDA